MEDPGITRLDIDHYRRALKLNLGDAAREKTLALLADAEFRLGQTTFVPRIKAER